MTLAVAFPNQSPRVSFAMRKLTEAILEIGETIETVDPQQQQRYDIVIASSAQEAASFGVSADTSVNEEGFEIRHDSRGGGPTLYVLANDESGAMYGVLELAERLRNCREVSLVPACVINARFPFRALKFNLPWSSYRMNACFDVQHETVRDLSFWESFLDMMAENRYNVLTLWNLHPFPYMIRPVHFPEATPFSDEELAEWKYYWTSLFRMALDRGIETYLINWNVFVSEAFREHYDPNAIDDMQFYFGDAYSTEQIKQYNRECVTQVIDEYPDLAGLGISLGERMENMTPEQRQAWIEDVYYVGMKQAGRPVKFIHRAPFSVDPQITRTSIENNGFMPEPVWVEVKFNWSHAYSSTKLLLTHGGSNGMEGYWNPPPAHYKITWMVRNEDFFTLRWAQPGFIRAHLAANSHDYVGGYYVGSECFIPAKDYSHIEDSPQMTWTYAFQKHWLYYMLWGRLLYDPETPDPVFEDALGLRYGEQAGRQLLSAYSSVCKMPMALASFYKFTWDFTLYAEGFLATNRAEYNSGQAFISLQDLLESQTFDPSYLSLRDYADRLTRSQSTEGFVTPLQLADALEADAQQGLKALSAITDESPALASEILDAKAWACLSLYFAAKLRAGVSYALYEKTGMESDRDQARQWLEAPHAAKHWEDLIRVTQSRYKPQPLMHLGETLFSWELFRPQIEEDIAFVSRPNS
ncbi:alpha-glucuronidase family glycosyl hydrolase [Paenibacillus piri]|uniref:Alpha glucuronidase N-terminal domain-containing protein n=1 Tax=Paenibacillus piri TaxID=2547395 RepID=A0A4R5KSK5_9BACL|nr:alpha-glucuronidase family glycosyl hydrolase [Paenibacillus piri]TDF98028.1 hypothetical protein E1757_10975 [Paenibacillus piri]